MVAGFYLLVGLLAVRGADQIIELAAAAAGITWLVWVQLAIGVGLFGLSFWLDSSDRKARVSARLRNWRARAVDSEGGSAGLIKLALGATTLEVATMLPYLAAIGLLGAAGMSGLAIAGALAAYCALMVVPAAALLLARVAVSSRVSKPLARLDAWFVNKAGGATSWVVAIVGFMVGADALGRV